MTSSWVPRLQVTRVPPSVGGSHCVLFSVSPAVSVKTSVAPDRVIVRSFVWVPAVSL